MTFDLSEEETIQLANENGLRVTLMSYGATLQAVEFPDKDGKPVDVVLGFDTVEEYAADGSHFGRTVGRVSNRIKNGRFTIAGKEYQVDVNRPPHHLHGGPQGAANRNWEVVRRSGTSATFAIHLLSSEDKYPGDVTLKTTYTVNDLNQLIVEHFAVTTETTLVNLTNHAYWNLDGGPSVLDHHLYLAASRYLPVDGVALPTGKIEPVHGTPFDFHEARPIGRGSEKVAIDNDMILDVRETGKPVLNMWSEVSGIRLELATSYPVVHLYAAMHLNGQLKGKHGKHYNIHAGLAIEAQKYSDAPSNPHFPSIELSPGETYTEEIVYTLSHC